MTLNGDKMKVLFVTNVPSPYRLDFFNELGKYCDLTVCFERRRASDRDDKWQGEKAVNYKSVQLNMTSYKSDMSIGSALKNYIKRNTFDIIIFTNYASPAVMSAISYCRNHGIRYFLEYDGGFYKKDKALVRFVKKHLLCAAVGHFTTCKEHEKYLVSLGIPQNKIWKYPFTSVREADIKRAQALIASDKEMLRNKLSMSEERIVLAVGQFIHRKGFDVLLEAAKGLGKNVGVYIVGGEPTEEYLAIQAKYNLKNVHFVGFKTKDELIEYYTASDIFVMPTREDIWGLVVNEAMSYGLPVVSSDKCIAALEMVSNGINGYIVPVDDSDKLLDKINKVLNNNALREDMATQSGIVVQNYTIEKMAKRHIEIFAELFR